ncbi:MAG: primosomal protein N' family DNA-binding protein, partial [Acidimicrobiia bacterium]
MPRPDERDQRVARVRPDLTAVAREFDYEVPDALAGAIRVGTVVRVPLHGRRVRGWVVGDDVAPDPEAGRLLPIAKVVGAGPPAALLDLARWTAHRWVGSDVALFRAA